MSKSREHVDALTAVLVKNGINHWDIDDQGRHYRLVFKHKGKERFYVFPRSCSDRRGVKNAVSDLRKMIEPPRPVRSVTAKPRAKKVVAAKAKRPMPDMPVITVKPDPWAKLAAVRVEKPTIWRRLANWIKNRISGPKSRVS